MTYPDGLFTRWAEQRLPARSSSLSLTRHAVNSALSVDMLVNITSQQHTHGRPTRRDAAAAAGMPRKYALPPRFGQRANRSRLNGAYDY